MTATPEATAGRRPRDTTINFGPARPFERAAADWYVEPRESVEALLRAERFSGLSWDPACGRGTIPAVLHAAGLDVFGSDIVDRGYRAPFSVSAPHMPIADFLKTGTPCRIDNVVSNPPFNLARQFVDCALTIASHKVAMLLPLTFLEGHARAAWLQTTPLARVHVFSWRISMPPGELLVAGKVKATGGKKCFSWFVFEHGWRGPPQVSLLLKPAVPEAALGNAYFAALSEPSRAVVHDRGMDGESNQHG